MEKFNTAGQATDDNIIRRMRIACWMPKATNTHSECVILIVFPLQQWLDESASLLHYTYIDCCLVTAHSQLFIRLVLYKCPLYIYIVVTSSPRMNATCLCTSLLLPSYTQSYMVKITN